MQISAKTGGSLFCYDRGGKPDSNYPDLELGKEFWNRVWVPSSDCKSLVISRIELSMKLPAILHSKVFCKSRCLRFFTRPRLAGSRDCMFGLSVSRIPHERVDGRRPSMVLAWQRVTFCIEVVEFWCWFRFGGRSVISISLSLTLGDGHFIRYIVTHQGATLQGPWRSLRSLSGLVLCIWFVRWQRLVCLVFSQPSIYIDGWLYGMRMMSVTLRCL